MNNEKFATNGEVSLGTLIAVEWVAEGASERRLLRTIDRVGVRKVCVDSIEIARELRRRLISG